MMEEEEKEEEEQIWLDKLQWPIMLAVMYFMFQLPAVRQSVLAWGPWLGGSDGQYNVWGLIVISGIFGAVYLAISRILKT